MMAHHPSAVEPRRNSWGAGEFGRRRRISLPPRHSSHRQRGSFWDISPAKDSPARQFQRAIYVSISERHPRWRKMGREMRPLSAAPHQARCGQMVEEFPEYTIERRRGRGIRPIYRGVRRKGAPAAHISPVRSTISRCSGDGTPNAFRGKYPVIRNMSPLGRMPLIPVGISRGISREMRFP